MVFFGRRSYSAGFYDMQNGRLFPAFIHLFARQTKSAPPRMVRAARQAFCLFLVEHVLPYAAQGANEIIGHILPGCAGRNAVIRRAFGLVIYIAANIAYVLFHGKNPFSINRNIW